MTGPAARPEWGGAPVSVTGHTERVRAVQRAARPVYSATSGGPSFAVADLLRQRGQDQRRAVTALLTTGLSPTAGRVVVVGSVFGGVGTSTVAAQLRQTWADLTADAVVLDATGHLVSGLLSRILPAALAGTPTWDEFADYRQVPHQIESDFAAVKAAAPGRAVLVVASDSGSAPQAPLAAQVADVALAASRSWPLVIVDAGADHHRIDALAQSSVPNLLVMVCRPDVYEIRAAANYLRVLHRSGDLDCQQSAVIVCVDDRRGMSKVALAVAATADAAAGAIALEFRRELHRRDCFVTAGRKAPDLDLLAATVAAASTHEKGDR